MNRRNIFCALAACVPTFMGGAVLAKQADGPENSINMVPLKSGPFDTAYPVHGFDDEILFRHSAGGLTRLKLLDFLARLEVSTKALEEEIGTLSIHAGRGRYVDAQMLAFVVLDAIEKAEFKVIS